MVSLWKAKKDELAVSDLGTSSSPNKETCLSSVFSPTSLHFTYFLKDFIHLFLDRGEGREKERDRNINVWLPLTCPLLEDLVQQPRYVP